MGSVHHLPSTLQPWCLWAPTGADWAGLGRGCDVWAVMFVPLVRPALLSGTAFDEDLLTLPVELSLALYPSPTSFLLHHFSSPELGQFSLEKRSCRGIFSVCEMCAKGSNEKRQSRSGTPQGVQRMDERQWTQTKAEESTLNIRNVRAGLW